MSADQCGAAGGEVAHDDTGRQGYGRAACKGCRTTGGPLAGRVVVGGSPGNAAVGGSPHVGLGDIVRIVARDHDGGIIGSAYAGHAGHGHAVSAANIQVVRGGIGGSRRAEGAQEHVALFGNNRVNTHKSHHVAGRIGAEVSRYIDAGAQQHGGDISRRSQTTQVILEFDVVGSGIPLRGAVLGGYQGVFRLQNFSIIAIRRNDSHNALGGGEIGENLHFEGVNAIIGGNRPVRTYLEVGPRIQEH